MSQEKKFFAPIFRTYNDDLSKRWRVEWYVPAPGNKSKRCPNPVYITGKTVKERYDKAHQVFKDLQLNNFYNEPKKKSTFFDKIFEFKIEWKPKTITNYRIIVNNYLEWCNKRDPLNISDTEFNMYLLWMKNKNHSLSNISKYRNVISSFYQVAIQLKLTKINPVQKHTAIKVEKKSLMFFTERQIELFKSIEIDPQLWLAIELLFYCFIRPAEQREMRISWINFENKFIEIPARHSKNGKTQKVAIPIQMFNKLKSLESYPNSYYVLSKEGKPGKVQLATKWINNEHRKVLTKLNIKGNYAFYSWKHTGAVKAVKAGINIKDLQLQLRHHSLDMVNEYLKNLGISDSEDLRTRFPSL